LTSCRALLGLVYFFPGFWKLRASGVDWITSDNLRNQMLFKWYEHGAVGPFRIDRHAGLLRAGAFGVVLLELSFPVLVFFRRTRVVAALGGFLFHALSQLLLFIPFPSLWLNYTMLFDWGPRGVVAPLRAPMSRRVVLQCILGAALVFAVVVQGARNAVQAWPFACYPTFAQAPGETLPDVSFEVTHASGQVESFTGRERQARSQFEWRRVFYLVGAPGARPPLAAFQDFAQKMAERAHVTLERGAHVRALRAEYATDPASWGRPPLRSATVLAWTVNR
jgi:hypothetical protein